MPMPDLMPGSDKADNSQYDSASDREYAYHKSPQTMQDFQYSNGNRMDDSLTEAKVSVPLQPNVPSYQKIKNKLETMRKQNISNVANNILSSSKAIEKPPRQDLVKVNLSEHFENQAAMNEISQVKRKIAICLLQSRLFRAASSSTNHAHVNNSN